MVGATEADLEGQELFLAAFIDARGDFLQALKAAQIPRKTFYRWLREDEPFKARYDRFRISLAEEIENEAFRRVLNPTANRGSDALVTKLLGGLRPDRYADKKSDPTPPTVVFISGLRDNPRPGVKDAEFTVSDPPEAVLEPGPDPEPLRLGSDSVVRAEGVRDAEEAGGGAQGQLALFDGIPAPVEREAGAERDAGD